MMQRGGSEDAGEVKRAYEAKLLEAAREIDRLRQQHTEQLRQLNDAFHAERKSIESRLKIALSKSDLLAKKLQELGVTM